MTSDDDVVIDLRDGVDTVAAFEAETARRAGSRASRGTGSQTGTT